MKRRSESTLPSGKMHGFSFNDSDSKIQSRLIEMIREQNFRTLSALLIPLTLLMIHLGVELVDHEMPKRVKAQNRALFLLELVEEVDD